MKNISLFRLGIMVLFVFFAVLGVIAFSSFKSTTPDDQIGTVSIWGTYNKKDFSDYLSQVQNLYPGLDRVQYTELSADDFDRDVLEALASGQSPDLLFIDETQLYSYLNKIYTITPASYSKQNFSDNFVELAEIYFQNGGIVALPLAADPLVMFWNRDIFSSEGFARSPQSWTEFFNLSQKLSIVDKSLNIRRSTVAFGEVRNVNFFREILATLLFQIGNPLVARNDRGALYSTLEGGDGIESAFPVLRFYTEFSDASKAVYSWNRSLPTSEESFLAGRLAVYFAPSSQIVSLRKKNPNLNFGIAEIPTVDEDVSRRRAVHATLYGFVIPKASKNVSGAFQSAVMLTSNDAMRIFTDITHLAPVRRDLTAEPSQESYQDILKKETIYARTFLDPNKRETSSLLGNMIEYITSGQRSVDNAIFVSNAELNDLLNK